MFLVPVMWLTDTNRPFFILIFFAAARVFCFVLMITIVDEHLLSKPSAYALSKNEQSALEQQVCVCVCRCVCVCFIIADNRSQQSSAVDVDRSFSARNRFDRHR